METITNIFATIGSVWVLFFAICIVIRFAQHRAKKRFDKYVDDEIKRIANKPVLKPLSPETKKILDKASFGVFIAMQVAFKTKIMLPPPYNINCTVVKIVRPEPLTALFIPIELEHQQMFPDGIEFPVDQVFKVRHL